MVTIDGRDLDPMQERIEKPNSDLAVFSDSDNSRAGFCSTIENLVLPPGSWP
jgi:hypothetical protein